MALPPPLRSTKEVCVSLDGPKHYLLAAAVRRGLRQADTPVLLRSGEDYQQIPPFMHFQRTADLTREEVSPLTACEINGEREELESLTDWHARCSGFSALMVPVGSISQSQNSSCRFSVLMRDQDHAS
ncbi:hypothetical protein MHYP_G00185230 [Metynnis hypsauchen]